MIFIYFLLILSNPNQSISLFDKCLLKFPSIPIKNENNKLFEFENFQLRITNKKSEIDIYSNPPPIFEIINCDLLINEKGELIYFKNGKEIFKETKPIIIKNEIKYLSNFLLINKNKFTYSTSNLKAPYTIDPYYVQHLGDDEGFNYARDALLIDEKTLLFLGQTNSSINPSNNPSCVFGQWNDYDNTAQVVYNFIYSDEGTEDCVDLTFDTTNRKIYIGGTTNNPSELDSFSSTCNSNQAGFIASTNEDNSNIQVKTFCSSNYTKVTGIVSLGSKIFVTGIQSGFNESGFTCSTNDSSFVLQLLDLEIQKIYCFEKGPHESLSRNLAKVANSQGVFEVHSTLNPHDDCETIGLEFTSTKKCEITQFDRELNVENRYSLQIGEEHNCFDIIGDSIYEKDFALAVKVKNFNNENCKGNYFSCNSNETEYIILYYEGNLTTIKYLSTLSKDNFTITNLKSFKQKDISFNLKSENPNLLYYISGEFEGLYPSEKIVEYQKSGFPSGFGSIINENEIIHGDIGGKNFEYYLSDKTLEVLVFGIKSDEFNLLNIQENGSIFIFGALGRCHPRTYGYDTDSCELCEKGHYSNKYEVDLEHNQDFCTRCNGGLTSNTGSTSCYKCKKGKVSNHITNHLCLDCPAGEISSIDGQEWCVKCSDQTIGGNIQYFQPSKGQTKCFNCPGIDFCLNATHCNSGRDPLNICSDCKDDYFMFNNQCISCPSSSWIIFVIGLIFYSIFGLLIFLSAKKKVGIPSLHIITMFLQTLSGIFSLNFKWPKFFSNFFANFSGIFSIDLGALASPECDLKMSYTDKYWTKIILPLVLILIFSIILIYKKKKNLENFNKKKNKYWRIFTITLKFLFIPYILLSLSGIDFTSHQDNIWRLDQDFSIELNSDNYLKKLLPAVLISWIYSLFIFIFLSLFLKNAKKNDFGEPFDSQIGWMYLHLNKNSYYWELIDLIIRFLTVFPSILYSSNSSLQGAITMIVLIFWLIFVFFKKPHKIRLNKNIKNFAPEDIIQIALIFIMIGIMCFGYYGDSKSISGEVFLLILSIIFLLFGFFLLFISLKLLWLLRKLEKNNKSTTTSSSNELNDSISSDTNSSILLSSLDEKIINSSKEVSIPSKLLSNSSSKE